MDTMKHDNKVHDSEDDVSFESEKRVRFSGPLRDSKRSSRRFKDNGEYEITLDIHDDSVWIEDIKDRQSGELGRDVSSFRSHLSSRIKQVSKELKKITSSRLSRTDPSNKSGAERALKGLQFITQSVGKTGWEGVASKFDELNENGLLPRAKFGKCIGMTGSSDEFAAHLFDTLARRRGLMSSAVTKDQLKDLYELLADKGFDSRLQTFFDMVDKNGDGRITEEEVKEIIGLSASANKLLKIQDRLDEYTALIMEALDPDHFGYIEISSLEALLIKDPSPSMRLGAKNKKMNQLLSIKLIRTTERNPIKRWHNNLSNFIENNWQRIWVIALWVLINVGLFTYKFIQFKHKTVFIVLRYCVSVAKGGAEICKLNMALILFTVCRNTITWLRSKTRLGVVVPFDDNINFHQLIAVGILVGIGLHAGAHTACNLPRILHATDEEYAHISKFFGVKQPANYWWFLRGTEGWTGAVMIVLMIIPFILALPSFRRNKIKNLPKSLKKVTGYNSFWYSHHVFVLVYILYCIHGYNLYLTDIWYERTSWMYLVVPLALYICERIARAFISTYKTVAITKVAIYPRPGDALEIHMSKPQGFKYKSGQYIYVKCPSISHLQWHPFSITSAPAEDHLSVHIRTLGDWTTELKTRFYNACQPATSAQGDVIRLDMSQGNLITDLPMIRVDGPYGAPSQDYKNYDVLLLVGLGIGATPLISIVKDVLYNIQENEQELENGMNTNHHKKTYATSRAYFYWVTREEGSFEWFKEVLNEVADRDHGKVIEMHNHCSSVYEEGDARSTLIAMLQSLHHEKSGVDIVSGTHVKTHFARPNWRNVFKQITVNHPDQKIGVFYCGDPILVRELRQLSRYFSRKTSTKFDFHKENF